MDTAYDVPDSTDWLDTPLKDFASLENALHCQICKEFYDTPMITSCNHTFCSKCIRTSLSSDGKCPACRASDQASKLRSNWGLQEVVSTFLAARPAALGVARRAQEETNTTQRPGKRKRAVAPETEDAVEAKSSGRSLRSKSRRIAASQESQPEPIEIEDSEPDEVEEVQEPEPEDGLVTCPLGCGKRMKEEQVFNHLDRCEDEKKQADKAKSKASVNGFARSKPFSSQNARPQDRINELNYGMMKETALSKKLKEIGISNSGSKQLMINRHKEWVNIWNANCDSTRPRTRRELLHELDTWERTQGGKAPNVTGVNSQIMRKDFDHAAYGKRHQDEFSRLIADARRKKSNPATETKKPDEESEQDEGTQVDKDRDGESRFFDGTKTSTHEISAPSRDPPSLKESDSSGDPKPYENNPEAISSIREKVAAVNNGQQIRPLMNEGFKNPEPDMEFRKSPPGDTHDFAKSPGQHQQEEPPTMFNRTITAVPMPSSQQKSEESAAVPSTSQEHSKGLKREASRDEHLVHDNTGSPCDMPAHLLDGPRKVPMFAVPSQPVRDIDGGAGDGTP